MKKIENFKKQEQMFKHKADLVKKSLSLGWEDSWVTDKNWLRSFDGVFSCKWCAGPMYAADYIEGDGLIMSCRTELCPGNIDHGVYRKYDFSKYDIREMTNQYLFNSLLKF